MKKKLAFIRATNYFSLCRKMWITFFFGMKDAAVDNLLINGYMGG
jgi:hypothetical protein